MGTVYRDASGERIVDADRPDVRHGGRRSLVERHVEVYRVAAQIRLLTGLAELKIGHPGICEAT
ncbi:hypothetical protein DPMN_168244 [Dreissena polymorpha]|uniref:Uncharacterized protein n=1 Tax=Dreissena polymorpha TaxID=45954 RepID=A0A9D4F2C8_DREPO|nr:hypothetical protein DPMN_168244 [Dreissena polymorpha]